MTLSDQMRARIEHGDWSKIGLSRRTLLRTTFGLSLAGLMAACSVGGDDDDDDTEATATDEPAEAAGVETETGAATETSDDSESSATEELADSEGGTRTIEHVLGTAEVPRSPQRIITLDPYVTLPTAVAADAPVIATCHIPFDEPFPVFIDPTKVEGLEDVGWIPEINLEKIVELNPDLIVGQRSFVEEIYDQLSEIAPTVAIDLNTEDGNSRRAWQDVVREVADVLNVTDAIDTLLTAYEERVAVLQGQLGDQLDTMQVSLANLRAQDDIRIYTADYCSGQELAEVGFQRPENQGPVEGNVNIQVSIERLKEIDGDVLLYFVGSAATNPEEANAQSEQIQSNPLWDQLEAVQNDQAYEVDKRWWFNCGSIQAADRILDDLFTIFEVENASSGDSETADSTDSAYPVVIEHKYGSTTIEAEPQRILSLGFNDHDAIFALGANPIAIRFWFGDEETGALPWDLEMIDAAQPELLNMPELDFELIANLQPDVIVSLYSGITPEEYETLTQIAPVVAQPGEYIDFGIPWQVQTVTIGKILGKEAVATQLVADVESQFDDAVNAHVAFDGAAGIVAYTFSPGEFGVYGPQDSRGRFLARLGFQTPQAITDLIGDSYFVELSQERMDLLEANVLVWIAYGDLGVQLQEDALYSKLPIHTEGRDIFPSEDIADAISFSSVLSLPYAIDQLVPMLAAAVDGDPSTTVGS